MSISIKKQILKEFEDRRNKAIKNAELKKQSVIKLIPEIQKNQEVINKLSIILLKTTLIKDIDLRNKKIDVIKNEIKTLENENKNILSNMGYSEIDFLPEFKCNKCKDTGYIDGNECSCLRQETLNRTFKQVNMFNLEEENFSKFDINYYSDEVKQEYLSIKSPKQNINDIKEICKRFIINFNDKKEKNLLFTGNTGLGKTFLSNSIAYELLKKDHTIVYQTSSVLMDFILKYRFSYNKDFNLENEYNKILDSDLLIIDDLGTEFLNSIKLTELFNILNTRILNNKKMIISTNLSLKKLYEIYDERIMSRIIGNFRICRFFGEDIRLKKKSLEKKNNI